MYLLAIHMSSLGKRLFKSLPILIDLVFVIKLHKFYIYFAY